MNRSGASINWLILHDLDHDAPCASALIGRLLAGHRLAPRVLLRVPVRAMESWMLADAEGFAGEFRIAERRLPDRPDDLDDPKQSLVEACRTWDPERAAQRSPSLRRTLATLRGLVTKGIWNRTA